MQAYPDKLYFAPSNVKISPQEMRYKSWFKNSYGWYQGLCPVDTSKGE